MRAKREITEAPIRRFRYAWPALGLALLSGFALLWLRMGVAKVLALAALAGLALRLLGG